MNAKSKRLPAREDAESSINVANELRGSQSVRVTFRLSEDAIHAVGLVAAHLGIRQKSLFDHLMEELNVRSGLGDEVGGHGPETGAGRVQKTYVISRRALELLERLARDIHAPRDVLVEFSVQRLMPIIEAERAQHERRKTALAELRMQESCAASLLDNTVKLLGGEDPVCQRIAEAARALRLACRQVEDFVERGRIIEERRVA